VQSFARRIQRERKERSNKIMVEAGPDEEEESIRARETVQPALSDAE